MLASLPARQNRLFFLFAFPVVSLFLFYPIFLMFSWWTRASWNFSVPIGRIFGAFSHPATNYDWPELVELFGKHDSRIIAFEFSFTTKLLFTAMQLSFHLLLKTDFKSKQVICLKLRRCDLWRLTRIDSSSTKSHYFPIFKSRSWFWRPQKQIFPMEYSRLVCSMFIDFC